MNKLLEHYLAHHKHSSVVDATMMLLCLLLELLVSMLGPKLRLVWPTGHTGHC